MLKKSFFIITLIILISCNNDGNKNDKIKASQWLLGKWSQKTEQGILEETWTSLNDSTLQGTSFFIKEKDTLHNELIILQQKGDILIYKATIKGQNNDKEISFPLSSSTDKNLVFENPKHDYPQKINYTLVNQTTLEAKISGKQNGKSSQERYILTKKDLQ